MTSRTTVSIIIIGDEILKGLTKDTNSHFLCKELYECGVEVARISVVPDDVDIIAEEIRSSFEKYSFVFTSGGIGPTHDDITYEGIAKAFGENVVLNKDLLKILINTEDNEKAAVKMSYVPLSSEIHLINTSKNMLFPVVSVKNVFAFPGIPSYLEYTFTGLKSLFCTNSREYVLCTLCVDRSENAIMSILNAAVKKFDGVVKFGSYPDVNNQYYQVKLSIEADSEKAVSDAEAYLRSHLPHNSVVGRFPPSCPEALSLLENVFIRKSAAFDKEFSTTVEESLKILDQCFDKYRLPNVCLSFNGGKDCTALLHLAHLYLAKFYPDRSEKLKVLYVRSKDPFQEIENFIELCVERYNLNLITYNSSIKDGLKQLQNDHPDIKAVLLGTRNTDPQCSDLKTFHMTDSDWPQFMRVNPLISWTYKLVWKFLRTLEVPYCSLYDRGFTSVGCKYNTVPNEQLLVSTKDETPYYLPAYLLKDQNQEREGRVNKV